MGLVEYNGFKVGDEVRLLIRQSPSGIGGIKTIWRDSRSTNKDGEMETVFTVRICNEADKNTMQEWSPVYLHELVRV